jgi:hypothetical protein
MISKCKYLTKEDEKFIEQIACDLDSGNHLLRPRSDEYWDYYYKMVRARTNEKNGHATHKQAEMCEYERQCRDYFYWKKLPIEKKLFVEDEDDNEI